VHAEERALGHGSPRITRGKEYDLTMKRCGTAASSLPAGSHLLTKCQQGLALAVGFVRA